MTTIETPTIEQVQAAHDEAVAAGHTFVAGPLAHRNPLARANEQ